MDLLALRGADRSNEGFHGAQAACFQGLKIKDLLHLLVQQVEGGRVVCLLGCHKGA